MNIPLSIKGKNILIAGVGGGYDVFTGLPIGIYLSDNGYNVFYANYSFSNLASATPKNLKYRNTFIVSSESVILNDDYFPEKYLASWLEKSGRKNAFVLCFTQLGVKNLKEEYEKIIQDYNIDALIMFDGGCDGIFRGDEYDLGTPSMDSISIIAGSLQNVFQKYYVLTAFGSEGVNKEVSHAEALQRMSELIKIKEFLGVSALTMNDPSVLEFEKCIEYVNKLTPEHKHSNIINSIRASYKGMYGDVAVTIKSQHSPIWISPLTSLYWFFNLEAVAKLKLFYKNVLDSDNVMMVSKEIEKFRKSVKKERPNIPI